MNHVDFFQFTDKGPRSDNQDAIKTVFSKNLFVACLADGVGGGACGALAASSSIDFFLDLINHEEIDSLEAALIATDAKIKELQRLDVKCAGMASTFTTCLIKNYFLYGVHTGDSRLCVLRRKGIKQLTVAHTEAERLYQAGKLTREETLNYPRKNVLDSAIGGRNPLIVQNFHFPLQKGDRILLTSDGVHDVISKLEFRDLSLNQDAVDSFGKAIVSKLAQKKITDNVSFIAINIS